jgi:hypothetical protein
MADYTFLSNTKGIFISIHSITTSKKVSITICVKEIKQLRPIGGGDQEPEKRLDQEELT